MLFAGVSVAVNIALALTLFPRIHEAGIATAESVSGWVNASLLFLFLRRRGHFSLDATSRRKLPSIALCCAIMAAALYGGLQLLRPYFQPEAGILHQIGALLLLMGLGGIVYFVAAEVTGAMSIRALLGNIRRKPAGP